MNNTDWDTLLKTIAMQSPVLVLGPGCRRIGYDDPSSKAWAEVHRRVQLLAAALGADERPFLAGFWAQMLSKQNPGRNPEEDLEAEVSPSSPLDHWRIELATSVFRALRAATRLLGDTILGGRSPVSTWEGVALSAEGAQEVKRLWSDLGARRVVEKMKYGDSQPRPALECHLHAAADVAIVLSQETGDRRQLNETQARVAERLKGLSPEHVNGKNDEATLRSLRLLKLDRIAADLEAVRETCFGEDEFHLDGSVVEWLSLLLRHVLVCDSKVPPSQGELTFHLNLITNPADKARGVGRPSLRVHPPGAPLSVDEQGVDSDIRDLLARRYAWRENPLGAREDFALTAAATLRAQWNQESRKLRDDRGTSRVDPATWPEGWRLPLAIVSDYDLSLEKALMAITPMPTEENPRQGFHVLIPVWTSHNKSKDRYIEWLFATFLKDRIGQPAAECTELQWLIDVEDPTPSDELLVGPIVIKLNGSPLHTYRGCPLDDDPGNLDLPTTHNRYSGRITPAVVYSESSSLSTIDRFLSPTDYTRGMGEFLRGVYCLNWSHRAWLYFGMGFYDWLTRVRLYFDIRDRRPSGRIDRQTNGDGQTNIEGQTQDRRSEFQHLAVDREFGWPEERLLEALGVRTMETQLENLTEYYARPTAQTVDPRVQSFLSDVSALRGSAQW